MNVLIGRKKEQAALRELLTSNESEFVALYGRRRVGKTFLINQVYQKEIVFEITGLNKAADKVQLENFITILNEQLRQIQQAIVSPGSWLQAFFELRKYIEQLNLNSKAVIFIDELPWLATGKSGFLTALENFWNSWASKRSDIILIVCGSAASWMISNIVKSRGGLHNRITRRVRLLPFTLKETEHFLRSRNIALDRYAILQLYMVMGGIPHYLKEVKRGKSAAQNIDDICFSKDGILRDEFKNLYEALFYKPDRYIDIIKELAKKHKGLSRRELIANCQLSSGGTTTRILESLEESGFISRYFPIGKTSKQALYKLTDPYSAFYLKFIANTRSSREGTWAKKAEAPSWKSWSGFAFERLCLAHVPEIKKALGIAGVYTEEASWQNEQAQIDLLLDRNDKVINLCEIKFTEAPFTINKKYAEELRQKVFAFRKAHKSRKTLFLTFISTFGLVENIHSTSLVEQQITMDALFE